MKSCLLIIDYLMGREQREVLYKYIKFLLLLLLLLEREREREREIKYNITTLAERKKERYLL